MAALSMATLHSDHGDLEWMMHYQIPDEQVSHFWETSVVVQPSKLPQSTKFPDLVVGDGLFTSIAREKGDYICAFPGYWMDSTLFDFAGNANCYGFSTTPEKGWPCMDSLVYVTHPCGANKINAGQIDDEVQSTHPARQPAHTHPREYTTIPNHLSHPSRIC
jgi:hypothetical protein